MFCLWFGAGNCVMNWFVQSTSSFCLSYSDPHMLASDVMIDDTYMRTSVFVSSLSSVTRPKTFELAGVLHGHSGTLCDGPSTVCDTLLHCDSSPPLSPCVLRQTRSSAFPTMGCGLSAGHLIAVRAPGGPTPASASASMRVRFGGNWFRFPMMACALKFTNARYPIPMGARTRSLRHVDGV